MVYPLLKHVFVLGLALLIVSTAVSQIPPPDDELTTKVYDLVSKGKIDSAEKLLDREVESGTNLNRALLARARFYFHEKDDLESAIRDMTRLIERDDKDDYYFSLRALMYIANKDPKAALKDLDQVLLLTPDSIIGRIRRANLREATKDIAGAEADFGTLVTRFPDDAGYTNSYAGLYFRNGNAEKAIILLRSFISDEVARNKGKIPKLRGITVKKKLPADLRSGVGHGKVNRYSTTTTTLKGPLTDESIRTMLLEQGSEQESLEKFAETYLLLGEILTSKNELEPALIELGNAVYVGPNLERAYGTRGVIFLTQKKYESAIEEFDKGIKIKDEPHFYLNRGIAKFMMKNEKGAKKDFEAFLKFYPNGKQILDERLKSATADLAKDQ